MVNIREDAPNNFKAISLSKAKVYFEPNGIISDKELHIFIANTVVSTSIENYLRSIKGGLGDYVDPSFVLRELGILKETQKLFLGLDEHSDFGEVEDIISKLKDI
jgi:hypothetical protein